LPPAHDSCVSTPMLATRLDVAMLVQKVGGGSASALLPLHEPPAVGACLIR
jgi:hypothetical protein